MVLSGDLPLLVIEQPQSAQAWSLKKQILQLITDLCMTLMACRMVPQQQHRSSMHSSKKCKARLQQQATGRGPKMQSSAMLACQRRSTHYGTCRQQMSYGLTS